MAITYSTYSTGTNPWIGHADGWRWVMRRLQYTTLSGLGDTPDLVSEVHGEMEQPSDPNADRRTDKFHKPFTVDLWVPNSGEVVARCLLVGIRYGYSASLNWVGARADASLVKLPEYRLPHLPLWHQDVDSLMAACDQDDGTRHVLAERMQDLDLWDAAEFVMKRRDDGRFLFDRGAVVVRLMRDFTVEQHARDHRLFLPGLAHRRTAGTRSAIV